ncbi:MULTISPECIES: succinate dehydrogenase cytochrome b subunit [Streptosporangium]|uniref:Succinate dehydrogenase / fumarate reductase cytochrome b subunit n=1 Tax=Streptosporangium brasiliense TaxID=47480 RepID=A0ABT9R8K0_9ACTN|nr:succinate dehydrogenase cytochrome b subunit [Streptosporangium brasiliense]MDP9865129.1 succinate dehydrogenase / fumarate reductase cytochrome b subunit [Streptosporangium brasiliense]
MTATIERGSATARVNPPAEAAAKNAKPDRPGGLLGTSNGKKAVMAVTGAILVLFLIGHMAGNLKSFFGAESFNAYAEFLRTMGEPIVPRRVLLTVVEVVLAVAVGLHMWSAISLARRASKARPVKYAAKRKSQAGGYAVHTMRYGGVVIVLFVIWHLLDLTFGTVNPAGWDGTPYEKLVQGFDPSRWWVTIFYVLAVVMVGLHLRHGLWSAFQTLGLASGRSYRPLKGVAAAISAVLVLGFLAVPIAVMAGVVK